LAAVEQQVRELELEVNEKETHAQRINADIDQRRSVLDKAKESSKEVDKIVDDLRSTIDVLKKDESTLTQQIDSMRRELSDLEN
jgi:septation ring formation regulator EzrA